MKKKVLASRSLSPAWFHPGSILLILCLALLIGGFLVVLKAAYQSKQIPAHSTTHTYAHTAGTPSLGVYVGSTDGALAKLDARTGTLLWRYKTQGTSIPAAVTVVAGTTFLGSQEGIVYALNASNGAILWQFPTGSAVIASPMVVSGVVYIGSTDGNLYALNASTGKALWQYRTGPANVAVAPSTVVVSNGVVYGSSSDEVAASYLFAVDAASGKQLWRISVQNQSFTAPQIANSTLYLASWALKQQGGPDIRDSFVYAFNAQNGSLLWRSDKIGDYIISSPTVVNGVLYAGSHDTFLYAFKADTGKLVWRTRVGGEIHTSPQVANGVIYTGVVVAGGPTAANSTSDSTQPQGVLMAINASSGAIVWQRSVPNYQGTPLVVFQNALYVGGADGSVYALNASSGATIWNTQGTGGVVLPTANAPITVAP